MTEQLELITPPPANADADWLVAFLTDRDWLTASQILTTCGLAVTENNKRWLRKLADDSNGRIIGHQKGYKLTAGVTSGEYQHWRNEWLKADASIRARIVEADLVFFGRQGVVG